MLQPRKCQEFIPNKQPMVKLVLLSMNMSVRGVSKWAKSVFRVKKKVAWLSTLLRQWRHRSWWHRVSIAFRKLNVVTFAHWGRQGPLTTEGVCRCPDHLHCGIAHCLPHHPHCWGKRPPVTVFDHHTHKCLTHHWFRDDVNNLRNFASANCQGVWLLTKDIPGSKDIFTFWWGGDDLGLGAPGSTLHIHSASFSPSFAKSIIC